MPSRLGPILLGNIHRSDRTGKIRPRRHRDSTARRDDSPNGSPRTARSSHRSAPADPPFSLTFNHASHTNLLGDVHTTFLSTLAQTCASSLTVERTLRARTTPPLGSTPAAIRASFTATTGESASTPGDGTLPLTDSAAWSPSYRHQTISGSFRVRLHTFHRSASVGFMLPVCRMPPGQ